jgi:hypothetical protein
MVKRGMSFQVSSESEVELKCLWFVEKRNPLMAHLAFPFIDQGKDPWYKSEREKRRKREMMEETTRELRRPFSCGSYRRQWRHVHAVVMSVSDATGEHRHFGHDPSSVTSATDGRRRSTAPPSPSLLYDMTNRSPCLESHRDRAAQCQSVRHYWRHGCLGIACGSR